MLTTVLLLLAVTQALTLASLSFALVRVARVNPATVQSRVDLAVIGTVKELLVELQEMTASALEELAHQRVHIDAILRDSGATDAEDAAQSFARIGSAS